MTKELGVTQPHASPDWRLAAIVEYSDDAIISKSLEGIITSWNPAATRLFGYTAEEAVGRPISIIVPPERGAEQVEILARLRKGERVHHFESIRMRKDGKRLDVSLAISPIKNSEGVVVGASKIARDITEWKLAQEQLVLERERWLVTLRSIGDGVVVTDGRGFIDFLNPVAEELTGWGLEEAKGKPLEAVFMIVNETTRQRVENPAVRAMREGIVVGLANHTILITRNGVEVAIDDSAAPIRDSAGRINGAVLVFRDVTKARAVDATHARLSAIVENSDDAIIGKSLDGRITDWNQGAERIFGYTASEAIGWPITMLIPPDRLSEETEILRRIRRGERVDHFETVRITKDRRLVDISLTISAIRDSKGEIIGASKIARSITEQKQAERDLAQAHAALKHHAENLEQVVALRTTQLRESLEELETFSSSLSHDLKAPLRAMYGAVHELQEDYGSGLPEAAHAIMKRVMQSCSRLTRFVDNVLAYSRLRSGPVRTERIELDTLVPMILSEYPHVRQTNAQVAVEKPLRPVLGHETLLTQMVANLISNGVKFVAPGVRPSLHIWTEQKDGRVRLWVEDNGIGIARDEQEKVFELFERLDRTRAYEGSGVGLAVVRRAARKMNGAAGVESDLGQGSRFWVELQAAEN
ncbi:MAG TPA: PAS domain S-box protein [Clostridia bacterium]|nr:PAS domain S-box protein [Clostridia bacterium]